MTHKADASFFEVKRPWSERKDLVLAYYLTPYLPKVATQKRPILLVDGFAGPGRFLDGKNGSPLILSNAAEGARTKRLPVSVSLLFVEQDAKLCQALRSLLGSASGVRIENSDFRSVLPEIERRASSETVFLYLDPFTVTGLAWADLDRVFRWVQARSSVEVLLNFSGVALTRIGCSLLKSPDVVLEEEHDARLMDGDKAGIADIDAVLGGPWWQQIVTSAKNFPDKVRLITEGYCDKLRTRFNEVCWHDIKERSSHKVPKYTLVFGSRHPDALELINDAAVKSRERLAEEEVPAGTTLFETRPEELVPDVSRLPAIVLDAAGPVITRRELVVRTIRAEFGRYSSAQIRKAIGELVRDRRLQNSTGQVRMNDDVRVWRQAPPGSGLQDSRPKV